MLYFPNINKQRPGKRLITKVMSNGNSSLSLKETLNVLKSVTATLHDVKKKQSGVHKIETNGFKRL